MLITSLGQSSQPPKLTPEQEAQIPGYIGDAAICQAIEQRLLRSYTKLSLAVQLAGGDEANARIPVELLRKYMDVRTPYVTAAKLWLQARAQVPKNQLPDPLAKPTPPPAFVIPSGTHGLSGPFGETVSARDVQVVFGPEGEERITSLGDATVYHEIQDALVARDELGFPPAVLVAYIFLVAIVGGAVAFVAHFLTRAEFAARQVELGQLAVRGKENELDSQTFAESLRVCVGTSTDPDHRARCVELANKAVKQQKQERLKIGVPGGFGFFATIGVIVVVGAVAAVGFTAYRRRRRTETVVVERDEAMLRREV